MNKTKVKKAIAIAIVLVIVGIVIFLNTLNSENLQYISYKEFDSELASDNIQSAWIEDDKVKFSKNNDENLYYTDNPNYDGLERELLLKGVSVEVNSEKENIAFVFDVLFYLFFFGIIIFAIYKLCEMNQKTFKVIRHTKVTFDDIAGMDELKKDMRQIVDVLKNPEEYRAKGIRQTKGIIFEGSPGNGKTLFAKALAEEMNVNFIATKGADFQSAMMSMGARKIKQLFKKAKRHKPCIIFIDEFDSIGERRNYSGTGVDKENNRIVTAMLNEMDGFDTQDGILVIAATNSYNSLDSALIRPGRFDLRYNISNPDFSTRIKLIDLYTKKKKLAEDVDKEKLAESFETLSCSGIETLLNESAMEAMLENRDTISIDNIINSAKKTNCNINLRKLKR
jgi:cell division protease FtsH